MLLSLLRVVTQGSHVQSQQLKSPLGYVNSHGRLRTTLGTAVVTLAALACSGCGTPSSSFDSSTDVVIGQIGRGNMHCDPSDHSLMMRPNSQDTFPTAPVQVPPDAARAIRRASQITGASAEYLAATAFRESHFRATSAAQSSSAQGMFQFIEQTWLATFAQHGECIGMGALARHIQRAPDGKHIVENQAVRQRILALRNDQLSASILAARLAQSNAKALMRQLGRLPTSGEVYAAHFLGATASLHLITLAYQRPWASAPERFPREAAANKSIFYSDGRPKSAYEVWEELIEKHDRLRFVL